MRCHTSPTRETHGRLADPLGPDHSPSDACRHGELAAASHESLAPGTRDACTAAPVLNISLSSPTTTGLNPGRGGLTNYTTATVRGSGASLGGPRRRPLPMQAPCQRKHAPRPTQPRPRSLAPTEPRGRGSGRRRRRERRGLSGSRVGTWTRGSGRRCEQPPTPAPPLPLPQEGATTDSYPLTFLQVRYARTPPRPLSFRSHGPALPHAVAR